jgi:hypothetical protein
VGPRRRGYLALAALVGVALATPAIAQGTVTIGSNLGRAPNAPSLICPGVGVCSNIQLTLDGSLQAANGIVSPVNGTITTWRIRSGTGSSLPVALRVVKPLAVNLFTGAGTSSIVNPPANSVTPYSAQLAIAIGDKLGLDCCDSGGTYFAQVPASTRGRFNPPPLVNGGPGRAPDVVDIDREIAINADIEPTSTFTVDKVKPGKGGKLTVTATLPNPGILAGGDVRDASVATAAAGKKKAKYMRRASLPVGAAGQTINLLVKPTNAARLLLAKKGKLKTKVKVVFTPTGGSASSQVVRVKLKR